MINFVLLIIVFTNFIYCSDLNITDGSFPTCPYTLFRRKRELPEYTRWRASLESTQEFIVKVLDDDLITPSKVMAVNIEHVKKGDEKIIIGGVMVPRHTTTSLSPEVTKDYTRFVPPTTTVTHVEGELYLAPIQNPIQDMKKLMPIQPRGRHPQRDESPPAGPQFLPRITATSWQYAPITPVGFTRRTTISPITPPENAYDLRQSNTKPTRTSWFDNFIVPTRTTSEYDDLRKYQPFGYEADLFPTATASVLVNKPLRSTLELVTTPAKEFDLSMTTKKNSFDYDNEDKKMENSDPDATYHMMFYSDYDENTSKKTVKESEESYEDKTIVQENETDSMDVTTEGDTIRKSRTNKVVLDYEEDDETGNKTSNNTAKISFIEIVTMMTFKEKMRDKRRPVCSMLKLRQLNFNSPRTLPEIVTQMKQWAENSPIAKYLDITDGNFTIMENPIYMMIVDDPSSGQIVTAKQTVMIVAGIQGRDHHAVSAAMYVLYQLIERSEAHADLLTKYRFWIIPVFNPDGYDYSMTFPHRREWTKNMHQSWDVCKGRDSCEMCEAYGLRCTVQPCYGVNLDRNFEYQWINAEELRSEQQCGSLYAGSRQLSEVETRALTRFLHDQRTPIYTFIAFKEGDVLGVMYPYSHTKKRRVFDHVYRQRASRAAAAAYSISGRPYVAGQTSEFLPLYAGGIEDWVYSHLGIDNTYTIVLFRPAETYNPKLVTERVVHEAYAAMDTLVLQSADALGPPSPVTVLRSNNAANAHSSPSTSVVLEFILALLIGIFHT